MKAGDRVTLKNDVLYGVGKITEIHGDLCDAVFPTITFTNEPLSKFETIEESERVELRLQKKREELRLQLEEKRSPLLNELRRRFNFNFIGNEHFYLNSCADVISSHDYEQEKKSFVQSWFDKNVTSDKNGKKELPDDEQLSAISSVHGNVQVIARAGSGKTSTLVNRAYFLQKHCRVSPDEMLLLAFNRKAANEIKDRLVKLCGNSSPYAMTFHALARAIVHPSQEIIYNDTAEENQGLDSVFSAAINDRLLEDDFLAEVRKLMLAQFKEDWEEIVEGGYDFSPEELYRFQKNLARETLRGEYVKSHGEKVIANFLFEHNIPYGYEQSHYWNKKGAIYKPDFTIPPSAKKDKGVVIEYFGLVGNPEYDKEMEEKWDYWGKSKTYDLVEMIPSDFAGGTDAFEVELKKHLQNNGIECSRLSDEEIWLKIQPRAIKRFSSAMSSFVGRCRKAWILPDELEKMVVDHELHSEVEGRFLVLAIILYNDYLEHLSGNNQQDFDGLMQLAASKVSSGRTTFERKNESGDLSKLRYIFIDEYQDFSELFHRLIESIRIHNPEVTLFCVGDNWQAINGFAGSNLKFYENFKSYYPQSKQLYIKTNYRSVSSVVNVGNKLMVTRGEPAVAHTKLDGVVKIANLSNFSPTLIEEETYKNGILTPVILRLAGNALSENKSVVLLSRRKDLFLPSGGYMSIDKYLVILRKLLPREWADRITISTTHSFKGRDGDVVIIIDALEGKYPLIHPNWIFSRIFGESLQQVDDENRRLFYVALTRAKDSLFIVTEDGKRSPYLEDIQGIPEVRWSDYLPVIADSSVVIVRVSLQVYELTEELKSDGYRFRHHNSIPVREKKFKREGFDVAKLKTTPWAEKALLENKYFLKVCVLDTMDKNIESYSVNFGKWTKIDKYIPLPQDSGGDDPVSTDTNCDSDTSSNVNPPFLM